MSDINVLEYSNVQKMELYMIIRLSIMLGINIYHQAAETIELYGM